MITLILHIIIFLFKSYLVGIALSVLPILPSLNFTQFIHNYFSSPPQLRSAFIFNIDLDCSVLGSSGSITLLWHDGLPHQQKAVLLVGFPASINGDLVIQLQGAVCRLLLQLPGLLQLLPSLDLRLQRFQVFLAGRGIEHTRALLQS